MAIYKEIQKADGSGSTSFYRLSSASDTVTLTEDTNFDYSYDDLTHKPIITLNGEAIKSPTFYAPTTEGTAGYVLTSTGNGAPEWTEPLNNNTNNVATTTTNGLMSSTDKTKLDNLTTYSTTEQKTGEKWIGGEDIYCIVATGTFASDLNFHTIVSNVSTLIDVGGTAQNRPFSYFLTTANNVGTVDVVVNSGNLDYRLRSTTDLGGQVYNLILKYTKIS